MANVDGGSGRAKGLVYSRRQILKLPLAVAATQVPKIYEINKDLTLENLSWPQDFIEKNATILDDVAALGRNLLFSGEEKIFGVYSANNPFGPPETITLPTKYASEAVVKHLMLGHEYRFVQSLASSTAGDDIIFFGGPVSNPYSRLILGAGDGSPILRALGMRNATLPFTFDLINPLKDGRYRPYSYGSGKRPDWDLLVDGSRVTEPEEYLLITVIPNIYSKKGRLVVVSGRGGPGTRAIDLVLQNRSLMQSLLRGTRQFSGWQVLITVSARETEIPQEISSPQIREVIIDFDEARNVLSGKPLFSDPRDALTSEFLGLLAAPYVAKLQQSLTIGPDWEPRLDLETQFQLGAIGRSQLGSAHSAPDQQERTMGDARQVAADSFFESPDFIATLSDQDKRWLEHIKSASQDEIENSLVNAGVYTPDGRLTKKYGGNA